MSSTRVFESVDRNMGGLFRWGQEDCWTGASKVFAELTGIDLAAPVRGQYSTEQQAAQILSRFGGSLLVLARVEANKHGLILGQELKSAPIGSIGISPRETTMGLDGRCACIQVDKGVWASKTLRGFALSVTPEVYWHHA